MPDRYAVRMVFLNGHVVPAAGITGWDADQNSMRLYTTDGFFLVQSQLVPVIQFARMAEPRVAEPVLTVFTGEPDDQAENADGS